jgi:inositol phosphorylceramide mannosyltransferase catalytic subunit
MRIPRIIHRIWLGPNEMPERYHRYGETWARHHPDWEMQLWTDENLPEFTVPGAYERCRNHGERSDLIRYEVLYRVGGVYVDTDFECQRSIEPLIEDASAFAAWAREGTVGNSIVGSAPGHPAIARLLEEVSAGAGTGSVPGSTGPGAVTRVFADADDVTILDSHYLYPFDHSDLPLPEGASFPDAYAVHHWEGTWKDRDLLQRRKRQLRKRLKQTERELGEARERERRALDRLEQIESTAWWRLRARAVSIARAGGRLLPDRPRSGDS